MKNSAILLIARQDLRVDVEAIADFIILRRRPCTSAALNSQHRPFRW
jgi:hypothetical protein